MQPEHSHQFVIPVEWEATPATKGIFSTTELKYTIEPMPAIKQVTKLRCSCGEEIDR